MHQLPSPPKHNLNLQQTDRKGDDFSKLWQDASDIWDERQSEPAFEGYVSADFEAIAGLLRSLQGQIETVLEWGSGLGVVAIMASEMGFEAYGIEAEEELVAHAEALASSYGPGAKFSQGSFIPDDFEWDPASGDEIHRTITDLPSAYDDLDMGLQDFDLIYAYPWPEEYSLFLSILRQFARPDALWLSYDVREGPRLVVIGEAT